MPRTPWIDGFKVGSEYTYREDGAQSTVKVISKEITHKGDSSYAHISLECLKVIHGGRFGEIEAGSKWTAMALLGDAGYPNAYAGWSLS